MISKTQRYNPRYIQSSGELFPVVLTKREIKANLHLITRRLVRRLIKIANYPNSKAVDKWSDEVYLLLHNISSTRFNRLPSVGFIVEHTYGYAQSFIESWDCNILADSTLGPSHISATSRYDKTRELCDRIYNYLFWIAYALNQDGEISKDTCKHYIKWFVIYGSVPNNKIACDTLALEQLSHERWR